MESRQSASYQQSAGIRKLKALFEVNHFLCKSL